MERVSCNKEGKTNKAYQRTLKDSKPRSEEKSRGEVRVGCKARMTIVKKQTGPNWTVKTFVEGHNHSLTSPSKVHLLRSHREYLPQKKY